jgi:CO/xanthine dehydrogenase FAD-binding subunit
VLSKSLIDQVAQKAMGACRPIDDIRGSAEYRRRMVRVLVRRLLTRTWDEMKAGEGS